MRLIDADKLYRTLYEIRMDEVAKYGRIDTEHCCSLSTALYEIYNAPTIDPVKHGRWVDATKEIGWPVWECSVCGGDGRGDYFVCPWRGAKMDEVME